MTLFVAAILLGTLAAAWVVLPLISRRLALLGDPIAGGVLDAEARKRVALNSLKEIEYDRIGGKLDDADYRKQFGVANPNLKVIAELRQAGVDVAVCGQAVAEHGYPYEAIDKSVTLALSALTTITELQQKGYALMQM